MPLSSVGHYQWSQCLGAGEGQCSSSSALSQLGVQLGLPPPVCVCVCVCVKWYVRGKWVHVHVVVGGIS